MAVDVKRNANFGGGKSQGDMMKVSMGPLYCANVRTIDNCYLTGSCDSEKCMTWVIEVIMK